jgi:hypothetical protein
VWRIHDWMWERGFVAMSAALGEPWASARAALDDAALTRSRDLVATLERGDRQKKAEALAKELGIIARDVEAMEVAWG